jgi:hypothetical protein
MREDNVISERKGVSISLILTVGGLFLGLIVTSLTSIYALGSWSGIINTKLDLIPSAINSKLETLTQLVRVTADDNSKQQLELEAIQRKLVDYDARGTPTIGPRLGDVEKRMLEFEKVGSPAMLPRLIRVEAETLLLRHDLDKARP